MNIKSKKINITKIISNKWLIKDTSCFIKYYLFSLLNLIK